jgi:hypothetical protein
MSNLSNQSCFTLSKDMTRLTSFLALTLQTPQVANPIPAKATMVLLRQLDGLDHHPPEGLQTSFGYGYWPFLSVCLACWTYASSLILLA